MPDETRPPEEVPIVPPVVAAGPQGLIPQASPRTSDASSSDRCATPPPKRGRGRPKKDPNAPPPPPKAQKVDEQGRPVFEVFGHELPEPMAGIVRRAVARVVTLQPTIAPQRKMVADAVVLLLTSRSPQEVARARAFIGLLGLPMGPLEKAEGEKAGKTAPPAAKFGAALAGVKTAPPKSAGA